MSNKEESIAFATCSGGAMSLFVNYTAMERQVNLLRTRKLSLKKDIEKIEQILQSKEDENKEPVETETLHDLAIKYLEYIKICDALVDAIDILCSMLKH